MSIAAQLSSSMKTDTATVSKELAIKASVSAALSAPPAPAGMEDMVQVFRAQTRQCWICERIAQDLDAGKDISEEDSWHFTTCVMSWDKLSTT